MDQWELPYTGGRGADGIANVVQVWCHLGKRNILMPCDLAVQPLGTCGRIVPAHVYQEKLLWVYRITSPNRKRFGKQEKEKPTHNITDKKLSQIHTDL